MRRKKKDKYTREAISTRRMVLGEHPDIATGMSSSTRRMVLDEHPDVATDVISLHTMSSSTRSSSYQHTDKQQSFLELRLFEPTYTNKLYLDFSVHSVLIPTIANAKKIARGLSVLLKQQHISHLG